MRIQVMSRIGIRPSTLLSRQLLFLLASLMFLSQVNAQAKNDHQSKLNDPRVIHTWLAENKVPIVGIGLIKGGQLKQVRVFGELKKGVPAPANTIFNVASLTKPVVAMLTLKLVTAGRWQLDEPLSSYWVDPDVVNDQRHKKLTTRHVLSHQTGFVNWRWLHESKKLTFDFEPGTKFQYSGEGFEYLKKALERKFQKPLEQLADELLFSPLGMKETQFYWEEKTAESRFALWHDKNGDQTYQTNKRTTASAADDLLTTVEDYGKFAVDVIDGAGLSKDLFQEMIRPQVKTKKGAYMGLGWEILKDFSNGEYALVHSGSDQGVKTLVVLLPKSKQGVIILTNGDNGYQLYDEILIEALDIGKELMERAE